MATEIRQEFIGRDTIIAQAFAYVLGNTQIASIPICVLSDYARSVTASHDSYEQGRLVRVETRTDCAYDDDGRLIVPSNPAGGLLTRVGDEVVLADGHSLEDILGFLGGGGSPHEHGGAFVRYEDRELLLGTINSFLGTKAIEIGDVPAGKPLILMDIDDCINVIGDHQYDGFEHRKATPDAERYDLDMDTYVLFPKEIVGARGSSGIRIPERMHVRWSSELARDMGRLHAETGATFVWMSSWMECSKCFESLLWPDGSSPFVGYRPWLLRGFSDDGRHGKALSVSELLGSPRSRHEREELRIMGLDDEQDEHDLPQIDVPCIVVVDDKGISPWDGYDLFDNAVAGTVPELTISPDGRYGMTKAEWHKVERFVRRHCE